MYHTDNLYGMFPEILSSCRLMRPCGSFSYMGCGKSFPEMTRTSIMPSSFSLLLTVSRPLVLLLLATGLPAFDSVAFPEASLQPGTFADETKIDSFALPLKATLKPVTFSDGTKRAEVENVLCNGSIGS